MYNPVLDEEAGGIGLVEEIGAPESLIEEPWEGESVTTKDVEVGDGSEGVTRKDAESGTEDVEAGGGREITRSSESEDRSGIVVQRLGSIASFGREIPVLGILSSEQTTSSQEEAGLNESESFSVRDIETLEESGESSEPISAGKSVVQSDKGEMQQAKNIGGFKRPEIALPPSPSVGMTKVPSSKQEEEEEEEGSDSEGEDAAVEEVEKLTSPLAVSVLTKTKARLQEPPPITIAVKDQIADSLKRSATTVDEATAQESSEQPNIQQPSIQANPEDDDPLEDTIIPEYKEKLKKDESFFWIVSQWACFLVLLTLLICCVNIKAVRDITWEGNNIWRWQAVALVILSGRLIAGWLVQAFVLLIEKRFLLRKRVLYFVYGLRKSVKNCIWLALVITIWETVFIERKSKALRVITRLLWCLFTTCVSWMLKVLAVKVAANGFHRSAYFERIQECLFNQYLLATLSAPPSMQITAQPGGEELITSRYNPHGSPDRLRKHLSKIASGECQAQAPIIARSANPIEQEKLQQLTSENVSAWTLKSLMKLIRKKNLASYSTAFSQKEGEWEIDSEVRAKAAAKQIFYNIASPGRRFLKLRDFLYFLPEDKATRAFALFEATENGTITKKAFVKWVVNVYKERRALALTLNDNKTVVAKLHKVLTAVHPLF